MTGMRIATETNTKTNDSVFKFRYWKQRWLQSKLRKLFVGHSVQPKQADDIVNVVTILNGLLLTIPFGILGNLNNSYWDWLQSTFQNCSGGGYESWLFIYWRILNTMYSAIYSSTISLVLSVLYYTLRPDEIDDFEVWWARAKWIYLIILMATLVSLISVLTLFGHLFGYYMNSTDHLCEVQGATYFTSAAVAVAIFLLVVIFSILAML